MDITRRESLRLVSHSRYQGLDFETRAAQRGKLLSRAIVSETVCVYSS